MWALFRRERRTAQATVTVRTGSPADAPAVRTLANAELGRSPTETRLRELLDRYPSVLAFDNATLCGFVFGEALSPDIIEMANLLVGAGYGNQGLGTELIRRFEAESRNDYRSVIAANSELWPVVGGEKRSVVALYRRLGYRELYSTPDTKVLVKELAGSSGASG